MESWVIKLQHWLSQDYKVWLQWPDCQLPSFLYKAFCREYRLKSWDWKLDRTRVSFLTAHCMILCKSFLFVPQKAAWGLNLCIDNSCFTFTCLSLPYSFYSLQSCFLWEILFHNAEPFTGMGIWSKQNLINGNLFLVP